MRRRMGHLYTDSAYFYGRGIVTDSESMNFSYPFFTPPVFKRYQRNLGSRVSN